MRNLLLLDQLFRGFMQKNFRKIWTGYFLVSLRLSFKTRPHSKRFVWKWGWFEWMNECVFIYRTYHIVSQGGLQFYLSEIGRQLVKAPLAAAISPYLISLTHPTHAWNVIETRDRPQHRELRALIFSKYGGNCVSSCQVVYNFNHDNLEWYEDLAFCRSHAEEIYYPLETFPLQLIKAWIS